MATAVQVESILGGLTDNSGQPLAAGKVYTYYAGSTTPVSLFTSSDKSTNATNPLILDGHGKAQVWADGRYKFVVKDQYDVTQYTLDNLLYGFDDSTVLWGGQSTGSANAHDVTVPATVGVYANGQRVSFIAGYTNTGATTLQLNALGAVSIVKGPNAISLQAGDIVAGQLVDCVYEAYSGTGRFRLENYPSISDVQRSRFTYATNVGGTNAIVAELSPSLSGYEAGLAIRFKASATNTGAVTVNLNSLGSKAVQRYGVALVGGEIKADDIVELVYDGAQFQLLNATQAPLFIDRTNNRVGIGTTTPLVDLDIQGTTTRLLGTRFSADAVGPRIDLQKSRGATVGTNAIVSNADSLGQVNWWGANGSTYTLAAQVRAEVDGAPSASSIPGRLIFSTGGVDRIGISSTGAVGIGTISPYLNLDVGGSTNVSNGGLNNPSLYAGLSPTGGGNTWGGVVLGSGVNGNRPFIAASRTGAGGALPLSFFTNGAERLQLTSDGNLLLGTTSNPEGARLKIETAHSPLFPAECLVFSQPNVMDNAIQLISFRNYNGVAAAIGCRQNSASNFNTELSFTTHNGSSYQERLAIRNGKKEFHNGQLVILATAIAQYGGAAMTWNTTTGEVGFTASSRLIKENITDCGYGLESVKALVPRQFFNTASNKNEVGFIADEVLAVIPEVVLHGKKSIFTQVEEDSEEIPISLEYDKMTAILCKAIQELNAKVDALQAQLRGA